MVELEIDGKKVEVPEGSMVMHAATELGIFVPHFCYHKKLSIAANCRMCLVEVEKAPKPLPACATPVAPGMKVWTASEKAIKAQKGVMEFLLINHPLDCPICDQGGECQLQDLAVGYGASSSRYTEAKRVVFHKPMGPLISAEEMSRCIHCTRCVRFGQEIGGVMELGMGNRGEHSEIMTFLGTSIDSELSGNMIDICPVGALTSKPFRYSARTWELARRKSVAPHDALGSNIIVQIKGDRVKRVVPLENESVNECWISDRDRFSYEALNCEERLTAPMIKQDGQWQEVDWQTALNYAAHSLAQVRSARGAAAIGALASPTATLEELHLLGALMRGLGSGNVDFRLRQRDFSAQGRTAGVPWLGMKIEEVGTLDRMLLVGSFLRKDHPLLAARVRQAVKRGARVSVLHAADDDLLMPLAARSIVAPSRWAQSLAGVLVAVLQAQDKPASAGLAGVSPTDDERAIAASLADGERKAVFLGNAAVQCDRAGIVAQLAQAIADATGARLGFLGEAANSVGGWLAGALPAADGRDARAMVAEPLSAYLLLGAEPWLDHAMPRPAREALAKAETVVALTAFRSPELMELADCLLPIAPFTETSGTFVNCEGRAQSFNGVVRPLGETRPGWKVLRVLANVLELPGFDFDTSESVRASALQGDVAARLDNRVAVDLAALTLQPAEALAAGTLERLADVPVYFADPLVRRAESLQRTRDARAPQARMSAATLASLGLSAGERVRVAQGGGEALVEAAQDDAVAAGVVRLAAAHASTAGLASMFGAVTVARA
ncbi:NADH-quinone oxidoreductase subunit NuoG [Quisquiliibacterium transsilvanicum]|uniref:NADH-quinone oxidoreductase n=1 Tax=Quisquiliibacterium transsilvanicum TaxID=1549638 RepID=A0A7W8HFD0_9BURK|nr:NADH-quinone oxidoreductase subunit NuoG [Quisquiliibacterium transsilvanicum]MBB5271084.1 NADH-quinone oxidoreductase subunit G [Quisquiliibacterium transsilvanicum]